MFVYRAHVCASSSAAVPIPNLDHLFEGVRGMGLMLGVNVMRVLPPLIVEEVHIAEFVERLSEAARTYEVPQAA